jgi:hypothetical protein
MELKIVTYIRKHGLDKAIADWKLKVNTYEGKILLKYNQLESPFGNREVEECRGLILEMDTWKVMSLGLTKFYNSAEGHAAKIDWSTARILSKLDGTCINLYRDFDKETWFAATTGTAEGEGEVNNRPNTSFNDLFWETIKNKYDIVKFERQLNADCTYVFELTTPYNIVVTPHGESSATLLTIRNNVTLKEYIRETCEEQAERLGVPIVEEHDLNKGGVEHLVKTFEDMPWSEEGYVILDSDFNRIKLKNPKYLAVHHLKGRTEFHHIMEIVKTNEVDEYVATFTEREHEVRGLKVKYDELVIDLKGGWDVLKEYKPNNITPQERKKYATKVFEVANSNTLKGFTGLYFGLMDGKVETIESYLMEMDNKRLYSLCK